MRHLIDGHLDLAFNALDGRDLTLPLAQLRANDPVKGQIATVTFEELRAANARVCCATLFALPARTPASLSSGTDQPAAGYTDAAGARAQALAQLEVYLRWQDQGHLRILTSGQQVQAHLDAPEAPLGVVLLMEGADPVRDAADLSFWTERGVRLIGLAWGATRYAGGTDAPGPLTDAGKELVQAMKELGVTLDASHLDDHSFWDAAELGPKMIASHSNARAFVPGNRHLTDEMARAIAAQDGMIGLVFLSRFIDPAWSDGRPGTPLENLARHAQHYADLIGWNRIGIGSDMDGGFGAEKTPAGIGAYRDLPRLLDHIPAEYREAVAGGNWARWLTTHL